MNHDQIYTELSNKARHQHTSNILGAISTKPSCPVQGLQEVLAEVQRRYDRDGADDTDADTPTDEIFSAVAHPKRNKNEGDTILSPDLTNGRGDVIKKTIVDGGRDWRESGGAPLLDAAPSDKPMDSSIIRTDRKEWNHDHLGNNREAASKASGTGGLYSSAILGEQHVTRYQRLINIGRRKKSAALLSCIHPQGGSLVEDKTAADLMQISTSLSCRNFFRARRDEESSSSSSSSSSDGRGENGGGDSSSSEDDSSDSDQYADGQPHSAKEISTVVKAGRVLPIRYRTDYHTLSLTTIIANYHGDATYYLSIDDSDSENHGDDHHRERVGDLNHRDGGPGAHGAHPFARSGGQYSQHHPYHNFDHLFAERDRLVRELSQQGMKIDAEPDPYLLDDPQLTGERRRKRINVTSYRCSIINHADSAAIEDDINQRFYIKHRELEKRGLKLTDIRRIKSTLMLIAMEGDHNGKESSKEKDSQAYIDVATSVLAVCYFEKMILSKHVHKGNRYLVAAVCLFLATKFYESAIGTGPTSNDVTEKMQYVLDKIYEHFGFNHAQLKANEFRVFAKLEFDLVVPVRYALTTLVRLLALHNITLAEHYSKSSSPPFGEHAALMIE